MLLSILGQPVAGFSQVPFEVREVVSTVPGNYRSGHIIPLDVDGDGDLDLLISGRWNINPITPVRIIEIHLNDGNGNFSLKPENPFNTCSGRPAIGDVDGDMDLDVIINGNCGDFIASDLYLNDGNGNFTLVPETPFPKLRDNTVEFFHYDNDGLPDVFVMGRTSEIIVTEVEIFRNLGGGNFEKVENTGIETSYFLPFAEFMDLENDGDTDIVFSGDINRLRRGTFVLLNEGGIFSQPKKISEAMRADIELGDYNQDGFPDLLAFNEDSYTGNRTVEYFLNDGFGNFEKVANHPFLPAFVPEAQSKDFDGDGDLDIFVGGRDILGNGNVLYINDGRGQFSIGNELTNQTEGGTAVGNFDGKGLDDILLLGKMGESKHLLYINKTITNEPPAVTNVYLSGTPLVGQEIIGTYDYLDPEEDADLSKIKWYRADDDLGTNELELENSSTTYLLIDEDKEKYIRFEVIPSDGTSTGTPVKSSWIGPVKLPVPKLVLKGNNLKIEEMAEALLENHSRFGEVVKNDEAQRVFTVENQGTADLMVSSFGLSGLHSDDFSLISTENLTIPPGGSETFNVRFNPSEFGERIAEVTFSTNDSDQKEFRFNIAGVGINSVPVFNSSPEVGFSENGTGVVMDLNASDGEGGADDEGVNYSISEGGDGHLFSIDSENGHLSFKTTPDFEVPLDSDEDNLYIVTVTADDGLSENNVSTQNLIVTVLNLDEAPTASCAEDFTIFLNEDGKASLTVENIDRGSWDDIEITEMSIFPKDFDCTDLGARQVVLTVRDSGGSTASCTMTVYIKDNINPSIVPPADLVVDNLPGACSATIEIASPEVGDNCSENKIDGLRSDSKPLSDPYPVGETTITWNVSDKSGNEGEAIFQKVTVKDIEAPKIDPIAPIEVESEPNQCGKFLTVPMPGATDNCDVALVTGTRSDARELNEIFPIGETTVSWQAKDIHGVLSEIVDQKIVVVDNIIPELEPVSTIEVENDSGQCGKFLIISKPAATDNCTLASVTGIRNDGGELNGLYPIGETIISWEAVDARGNRSEIAEQKVIVTDVHRPVIEPVTTIFQDSDTDACGTFITIIPPSVEDNCNGPVIRGYRSDGKNLDQEFPVGRTEIIWTAEDVNGMKSESVSQIVIVANKAPENISISGPDGPRQIGTPIFMKASFTDENIANVTWKAFNGNQVVQEYSAATTGAECTQTFENLPAGVYTMILELEDHCGMTSVGSSDYVVLYDPNGGFVTGGGWLQSPKGALTGSEVEGKAHFGFNAKYKNGKNEIGEVGGNTSFQFKAGELDFKSDSHEEMSLVVSGGFKATYKGSGKVNDLGDYKFMVTVIDADETPNYNSDLFRIKIWNDQGVLYDNMQNAEENADPTTAIGGGSIVIHKPKADPSSKEPILLAEKELMEGVEVFTAYPNPMEESAVVQFRLNHTGSAALKLYDLNGREIFQLFQGKVQQATDYEVQLEKGNLMKGMYILRLVLDSGEAFQKQFIVN